NLLLAEWRAESKTAAAGPEPSVPAPELQELDPQLDRALRSLGPADREALLLVAWEDLAPTQAARVLGVKATAFRVRLLRARRRLQAALAEDARPLLMIEVEEA